MISISVNGDSTTVTPDATIADVLRTEGVEVEEARGIAVARNDEIVRRGEWTTTGVAEGDRIEIVTARQGG